jgi:hypothetical protein
LRNSRVYQTQDADIFWYEQKAVVGVLVEKFGIQPIGTVQDVIAAMMAGK